MTHPVVVIDGSLLISAELGPDQNPNLEEVPFAPLQFGFSTAHYEAATYRVDLVTLKSLTEYLKIVDGQATAVYKGLFDAKRSTKP